MYTLLLLFATASAPAPATSLAAMKARVMSADYRADIDELARLRDELAKVPDDTELAYLARYWRGFASWRMAINGTNHGMKGDQLAANLKDAASSFYASVRLKNDFADGYAGAALVNSWLATFLFTADPPGFRERISLSETLYARAVALAPDNPRVLWAKGAFALYGPKGNAARAIEIYREMLKEAERRGVDPASPQPDWGKPEALMSLAYAHMSQTPPDLTAAREEANAALKAAPEWSYVRDNLLPQIEEKSKH